ncbi:MAG: VPLPA-CTERM sorting domain-containing protein [Pseudomonadota bacterium]|nr:VPLPA-CTERM sorting domain-containing protein [Pseudomonadota bacterium]
MNILKTLKFAAAALILGVSSAHALTVSGLTIVGQETSGNCPVDLNGDTKCFLSNGGSNVILTITADAGYTFDVAQVSYLLTGGGQLRKFNVSGSNFATFEIDNVPPTGVETVNLTGLTFLQFANVGNASARIDLSTLVVTPPAVPLPAAGFLLLGGFGALAAVKRRKKS